MYIIIVGGGSVGYYLLKALLNQGHEVLLVEKNASICEKINDELGSVCFRGDGCELSVLNEVGTSRAEMLIAVTGHDEDNLVACQLAKYRFDVRRTVARIGNPKNESLFKKLGVDVTISSTNIILENIQVEVPTHPLTHLLTFRDRGLEVVEVRIPSESATSGKRIQDLILPAGTTLILIIREAQKPIPPTDDTVLRGGDQVIAVTRLESEEALRTALRGA